MQCVAMCCTSRFGRCTIHQRTTLVGRHSDSSISLSLSLSLPPLSHSLFISLVHSLSLSLSLFLVLSLSRLHTLMARKLQHAITLQCNTIEHTVTHCNALQQTHCNVANSERNVVGHLKVAKQLLRCFRGSQCCSAFVAVCCSVLQRVAVCCSVL